MAGLLLPALTRMTDLTPHALFFFQTSHRFLGPVFLILHALSLFPHAGEGEGEGVLVSQMDHGWLQHLQWRYYERKDVWPCAAVASRSHCHPLNGVVLAADGYCFSAYSVELLRVFGPCSLVRCLNPQSSGTHETCTTSLETTFFGT